MGLSTTYTKTETDFLIQQLEEKISDKYNDESASISNDIIKFIDINTGEDVNYREVTTWHDGTAINDEKTDGIIFIKKGSKYYKRQFENFVNAKWFGAKGDGVTNDTIAIQKAINSGLSVFFERGKYLIDSVNIPFKFKGNRIFGVGFDHYSDSGTVFIPNSETDMFTLSDGANNINFSDFKIDGEFKALKGINGSFGAMIKLTNVGVYRCKQYGVLNRQGLMRVERCFFAQSDVNLDMYSDGSINATEFTTGRINLRLSAGGNRLTNIWINGATECNFELKPLDTNTEHMNTSISNYYIGEVYGESGIVDNVRVIGNSIRKVRFVQFGAGFFIHATDTNVPNNIISIENSEYISFSPSAQFLAHGSYATESNYTNNAIKIKNSRNITINGLFSGCNKNTILADVGCENIIINSATFDNCTAYLSPTDAAIILSNDEGNRIFVNNCLFGVYNGNANTYALSLAGGIYMFNNNTVLYPNINTVKIAGVPKDIGLNNLNGNNVLSGIGLYKVNFMKVDSLPDPSTTYGMVVKYGGKLFYNYEGSWKSLTMDN